MKNTATLGQIQKILTFLEGIPSEQVQKVIESGFFSDVIRNGELDVIAKQMEAKRLQEAWKLIGALTGFKDISITVPHVRYRYAESGEKGFQLRCWQGEHGYSNHTVGHVDSGTAKGKLLFETRISKKLDECQCCWLVQLQHLGLSFSGDSENEWVSENKGNFDIITLRPRKQS